MHISGSGVNQYRQTSIDLEQGDTGLLAGVRTHEEDVSPAGPSLRSLRDVCTHGPRVTAIGIASVVGAVVGGFYGFGAVAGREVYQHLTLPANQQSRTPLRNIAEGAHIGVGMGALIAGFHTSEWVGYDPYEVFRQTSEVTGGR